MGAHRHSIRLLAGAALAGGLWLADAGMGSGRLAAQTVDVRVRDAATAQAAPRTAAYPLGIMARNTATGVEIAGVNAGSAAQAAGLEQGDTILAVAGYQVGLVGDHLYDVADEVARRVGPTGQVPLLVRKRSGALAAVPLQFGSTSRAISGVLTADSAAQVPSTSVITVRLLDVTEPQWRDVALTQGQLPVGRGFPVSYRLDPPQAAPQHRYAIDARVEDSGRLVLQTAAPVPIASSDREQRIDLPLVAAAAPAQAVVASVAPNAQIQQWITTYLGRPPKPYETEVWLADLQQGKSLGNVQAGILSSSEYFERCRSNRDTYVTEVFRQLYGTQPSPAQLADLQARYDRVQGVRLQFVEQLLQQSR
ncbi:MAG: hypothetical protein RLZZ111_2375 [Planctomycetota bacterium]